MRYTVTTFKVCLEVAESGIRLKDSKDAEIIARGIFNRLDADKEHFVVMATDNKNPINGYKEISTGTATSSLVTPAEVFLAALRLRTVAIVCVHNHPAGDPMPSEEDRQIAACYLAYGVVEEIIQKRRPSRGITGPAPHIS